MNRSISTFNFFFLGIVVLVASACSTSEQLTKDDPKGFTSSSTSAPTILDSIPNYSQRLQTLKGKARAIVSEPNNTERVTVLFSSNRNKSLVTVRNSLGIEGGQLLTDGDTLLVYNKIDKFAREIPIRGGNLDRINRIASLNILDMINYTISGDKVDQVLENETLYQLQLTSGTKVFINKKSSLITQVSQPAGSELPYSKITYDAYANIDGFKLPRRISIFGTEGKSKVALQITDLQMNPKLEPLTLKIPNDIPVYSQ